MSVDVSVSEDTSSVVHVHVRVDVRWIPDFSNLRLQTWIKSRFIPSVEQRNAFLGGSNNRDSNEWKTFFGSVVVFNVIQPMGGKYATFEHVEE